MEFCNALVHLKYFDYVLSSKTCLRKSIQRCIKCIEELGNYSTPMYQLFFLEGNAFTAGGFIIDEIHDRRSVSGSCLPEDPTQNGASTAISNQTESKHRFTL